MKKLAVVLAVALLSVSVMAAPIATYDTYGVGSSLSFPITFAAGANVESATFAVSSGLSVPGGTPAHNQISAVGWDTGCEYFSLSVVLEDGYVFGDDVALWEGGLRASGTGPSAGTTAVIVDGVETIVHSYTLNTSYKNFITDVAAELNGASEVEIRWYGTGATSAGGTHRVGNYYDGSYTDMGLYGSVAAVPEPATMALLGLGSLMFVRRKK